MVNPETRNVKPILITEEYRRRFGTKNWKTNFKLRGKGGESELRVLRLNSDFIFNGANGFGRDGDKLDAHPHPLEAITDFAPSLDRDSGPRELEAQFQGLA